MNKKVIFCLLIISIKVFLNQTSTFSYSLIDKNIIVSHLTKEASWQKGHGAEN